VAAAVSVGYGADRDIVGGDAPVRGMTKLVPGRSVVRETGTLDRGDPLVVTLHVRTLEIRVKGRTKSSVTVGYDDLYSLARKIAARWTR
jgi:hypothetical protein